MASITDWISAGGTLIAAGAAIGAAFVAGKAARYTKQAAGAAAKSSKAAGDHEELQRPRLILLVSFSHSLREQRNPGDRTQGLPSSAIRGWLNFTVGVRNKVTTDHFIEGLRAATSPQKFQLTTDGFKAYPSAIDNTLSDRVDFAQLIKGYRATPEGERKYSPAEVVSTERILVVGNPDPRRFRTSIVERSNLPMRMRIRPLTRLTNGFSKKWENHRAALCLNFAYYNFVRIHRTLRATPAMAAGITDHVWDIAELLS